MYFMYQHPKSNLQKLARFSRLQYVLMLDDDYYDKQNKLIWNICQETLKQIVVNTVTVCCSIISSQASLYAYKEVIG